MYEVHWDAPSGSVGSVTSPGCPWFVYGFLWHCAMLSCAVLYSVYHVTMWCCMEQYGIVGYCRYLLGSNSYNLFEHGACQHGLFSVHFKVENKLCWRALCVDLQLFCWSCWCPYFIYVPFTVYGIGILVGSINIYIYIPFTNRLLIGHNWKHTNIISKFTT